MCQKVVLQNLGLDKILKIFSVTLGTSYTHLRVPHKTLKELKLNFCDIVVPQGRPAFSEVWALKFDFGKNFLPLGYLQHGTFQNLEKSIFGNLLTDMVIYIVHLLTAASSPNYTFSMAGVFNLFLGTSLAATQ